MAFVTGKQFASFLKRNCPKYDSDRIVVTPKIGSSFCFVIESKGKLIMYRLYSQEDAIKLIPKLNQYFNGDGWEPGIYCEFYQEEDPAKDPPGFPKGIFCYPTQEAVDDTLELMRRRFPGCGLAELASPTDGE